MSTMDSTVCLNTICIPALKNVCHNKHVSLKGTARPPVFAAIWLLHCILLNYPNPTPLQL